MSDRGSFDVIIIGGSYAGLSAAMSLGRSLRNVLVIDSGNPCNKQTPHSHNFITHDGETPAAIAAKARAQVQNYETVKFLSGFAINGRRVADGFEVEMQTGEIFHAKKLLLATGVTDIMPTISGFKECWGISVLHCPYCHGYEVKQQNIAVIANGDAGLEYAALIRNLTPRLTVLTNGPGLFSEEQVEKLKSHRIHIMEAEISALEHTDGKVRSVLFKDNTQLEITALFAKPAFTQQSGIPQALGCTLTEHGHIDVDAMQQTSVHGVYAAGDNTTMLRSVAAAVAAGNKAGAVINRELVQESF